MAVTLAERMIRWYRRRRARRILEQAETVGWVVAFINRPKTRALIGADVVDDALAEIDEFMARHHGPEAAEHGLARQVAEAFERGRAREARES